MNAPGLKIVAEDGFELLRKPIQRVTTPDLNIPFAPAALKWLVPAGKPVAVRAPIAVLD